MFLHAKFRSCRGKGMAWILPFVKQKLQVYSMGQCLLTKIAWLVFFISCTLVGM